MGNFDDFSSEEKGEGKNIRDEGFNYLKKLSFEQLIVSVVCIIIGIVSVASDSENPNFPYICGAPVYCGVMAAVCAILGLLAVREGIHKHQVSKKVQLYILTQYTLNIILNSLCIMTVCWGIIGILFCKSSDEEAQMLCQPNGTVLLVTSVLSVVAGLLLWITSVLSIIYFCYNKRSLGFIRTSCCGT